MDLGYPKQTTIREAYLQASSFLRSVCQDLTAESREAENSAELLLMHLLGVSRTTLLMKWGEPLPGELASRWEELIARRAAGEPVQYITGVQEFYGIEFEVNPAVLIPRPETELLVEQLVALGGAMWPGAAEAGAANRAADAGGSGARAGGPGPARESAAVEGAAEPVPTVVDVGTGSGAIAVSIARLCPRWRVAASDISAAALAVARRNAARAGVAERIRFLQGDLLSPVIETNPPVRVDILVSNPPYIATAEMAGLQPEVRLHEPHLALHGGADGLDCYRRIIAQIAQLPQAEPPGLVGFEVGAGQASAVANMLRACGWWPHVHIVPDLASIDRHVIAKR